MLGLYHPEIPQNTGTLIRLSACLGVELRILEPCGFIFADRFLKRAALDYDMHNVRRYTIASEMFQGVRVVTTSPTGKIPYCEFQYQANDLLLFGPESTGLPEEYLKIYPSVYIPQQPNTRSLNLAVAAAMIIGEKLRQTSMKMSILHKNT